MVNIIVDQAILIISLFTLILGCLYLNKSLSFPGAWALIPVIPTAIILQSNPIGFFSKFFLSNQFIIWIGKISYPLYLWHWPILSMGKTVLGEQLSWQIKSVLIAIALFLSWLTLEYIEKPIRYRKYINTKILCLLILLVYFLAQYVNKNNGLDSRFSIKILSILPNSVDCTGFSKDTHCIFGNIKSTKVIILYGDSHSEHLTAAINASLGNDYKILYFGGNCFDGLLNGSRPVFFGISESQCESRKRVMKSIIGQDIYAVIHAQRWAYYKFTTRESIAMQIDQEKKRLICIQKK